MALNDIQQENRRLALYHALDWAKTLNGARTDRVLRNAEAYYRFLQGDEDVDLIIRQVLSSN